MKTMTLGQAIVLAATIHQDQKDQSGKSYILHPIQVMTSLIAMGINDELTLMLAIFHDAIEDSAYTVDDFEAMGVPKEVCDDLRLMSKVKGEDYETSYIVRLGKSYRCVLVKMADLTHNMDMRRLKGTRDKDFIRMAKYCRSYVYLEARLAEFKSCIQLGITA